MLHILNIVGHMAPEHGVNCFNMCSAQCFRKPNSAEQLVILFGQFCVVDATFFSLWISFASTGHLFSLRIMLWWIVCYIKPFVRKSGPLKYVLTRLSSITRKRYSRITGVTRQLWKSLHNFLAFNSSKHSIIHSLLLHPKKNPSCFGGLSGQQ